MFFPRGGGDLDCGTRIVDFGLIRFGIADC